MGNAAILMLATFGGISTVVGLIFVGGVAVCGGSF